MNPLNLTIMMINFLILGGQSWLLYYHINQTAAYYHNPSELDFSLLIYGISISSLVTGLTVINMLLNIVVTIRHKFNDCCATQSTVTLILSICIIAYSILDMLSYLSLHKCIHTDPHTGSHTGPYCENEITRIWKSSVLDVLAMFIVLLNVFVCIICNVCMEKEIVKDKPEISKEEPRTYIVETVDHTLTDGYIPLTPIYTRSNKHFNTI